MRHARDAGMLVHAPDLVRQIDGNDGRMVALHHEQGQSIRHGMLDHPLLKSGRCRQAA